MANIISSVLIFIVIYTLSNAEPGLHTLRIRFPGPSSNKIEAAKPAKQQIAPYLATGLKPKPPFELPNKDPEMAYLPPTEPELSYGPPKLIYGPPEISKIQSAAISNAPLQLSTQFTPPRLNKAVNFRPLALRAQSAAIVNAPSRPINHLTVPRPQRIIDFRSRRFQAQQMFPQTHFTLPRAERLTPFRPRRIHTQQQTNKLSRPLPSNIFANSSKGRSGRPLPSNIFSH